MLTISEFSTASRLTVKALRIYHEEGILVPEKIDGASGYRYYGDSSFEKAASVVLLKDLGFSLKEMKNIFDDCSDDDQMEAFFRKRLEAVNGELAHGLAVKNRIQNFLEIDKGEHIMKENFIITEKNIADSYICSIRYKGKYPDIGMYFGQLFRKAGRYCKGSPFALYWDREFREDDADIEAGVELRKMVEIAGMSCRCLSGGKAVSILFKGSYDHLGDAYKKLFDYLKDKGYEAKIPCREIYLKGPGMILPRSPRNFITEIQVFV